MPMHSPAQLPAPSRTLHVPSQVPRQVPEHDAAAVSSHEPVHEPAHSRLGAVPEHLSVASPLQLASALAMAVHLPSHLTLTSPGSTEASHSAAALAVTST